MPNLSRAWTRFWAIPHVLHVLLLIVLIALAVPVFAGELVLKNQSTGGELRLLDEPCTHGQTLAILAEEWRPKFRNARILDRKGFIQFYGCWIDQGDGTAVVILQDGAALEFQLSAFADPMT